MNARHMKYAGMLDKHTWTDPANEGGLDGIFFLSYMMLQSHSKRSAVHIWQQLLCL